MFNLPALDVASGLIFLYLSLALMVTAVNEWIAAALQLRGKTLQDGIGHLLDGGDRPGRRWLGIVPRPGTPTPRPVSDEFYAHPLITSLSRAGRVPSYVPPRTFALVVKELASKSQEREGQTGATGAAGAETHMQRQFRALALGRSALDTRTQTDVLESWFNDGMERVSGWYKRRIQLVTIIVAAGLTVLTNADTFHAASVLWENPTARAAFLEQARLSVLTPVATEPIQAGVPNFDTPAPETRRRTSAEFVTDASERETLLAASRELSGVRALGLGSFIGWSEVFHEFNDAFCAAEQEAVTAACRLEGSADEARCRALIDRLALDKRCHEDGANRLGTMAFPGWPLLGRPTILLRLAVAHVGGWFLTIVALSLGAPFWFDLLGRFVNIRSAGAKPA